jgi:phosphatidylglycerol:prolipoprotein diacylglycerol transferase
MIIPWNASPEIFNLGPLTLRWYGLMFLMGFSLGYSLMKKACLAEGKPTEALDSLLVHLVLGTTIGARLGHCLFYDPAYYLSRPLEILKIWEGGLASHGGVAGVIFATWLFLRKNPEFNLFWLYDRLAIFTAMTGGFIRIGNLMNSEILGKPTDGSWGVVFQRVDQIPRHPAMIYESLSYFAIFALSYGIYLKKRAKMPSGFLFGLILSLIFTARFFLEFFKENQSSFENEMAVNMGQLLSLPFVAIGIYLMLRVRHLWGATPEPETRRKKKSRKPA